MQVITGLRTVSTTGSSDGDVRTVNNAYTDQGFFFIIPEALLASSRVANVTVR